MKKSVFKIFYHIHIKVVHEGGPWTFLTDQTKAKGGGVVNNHLKMHPDSLL